MKDGRIESYVIDEFMKFERKLYMILDIKLGRPIYFKTIVYVAALGGFFLILSQFPLFNQINFVFYVAATLFIAHVLTDTGTENRSPVNAFKSFVRFHVEQLKGEKYYKGRVLPKDKKMKFGRVPEIRGPKPMKPKKEKGIRFKKGVAYK